MSRSRFSLILAVFLSIVFSIPAQALQFDKTKPPAGIEARLLDNYIRENNDGLEDAISRDHKFPTGYGDDAGEHTQVTFNAPLDEKPSLTGTKAALYTKTLNGKSELFYEDNNGSEFLVMVPVGTILPVVPGYFTNGSNAGYTYRLGTANTIAAINALYNPYGFYVCNGAALNLATSPIFNGASRYLPNLTDDRFLMGDTAAGAIGGAATHTHTTGNFTLTTTHIPSHKHTITVNSGGSHAHNIYVLEEAGGGDWYPGLATGATRPQSTTWGGSHTHTATASSTGGGQAHNHGNTGSTNHLPTYLSCFYIMRVH
jgi:hypothetical protein